jgi:glycine dehydrogenase
LAQPDSFAQRHLGSDAAATRRMLEFLGFDSMEAMVQAAVPSGIRLAHPLRLPPALSEFEALSQLRQIAGKNRVLRSFIGMGYYDCITPPVIQRNVLENPGWYTQYTPYQAEIAQGRLEALLNFQTMIADLTGLEVANASLLDEGTAAAEAMAMCLALCGRNDARVFFVSERCFPQTIDVLKTRAQPLGLEIRVGDHRQFVCDGSVFGVLLQYPTADGTIFDYRPLVEQAHSTGAKVVVAADLLSLVLLRPPGEFGADIAVGNSQRFGVPMGFGGPHAAYFATRNAFKRQMPGRLIGISRDAHGKPAYRLSLQTREQHIRREKATSNICTAQALLAILASLYAVYHGPEGLKRIARRIHQLTAILAAGLERLGYDPGAEPFFDTLRVGLGNNRRSADILKDAEARGINLWNVDDHIVGVSLDETASAAEVTVLWQVFNGGRDPGFTVAELAARIGGDIDGARARTSGFLTQPVFNRYHSETEMLRYIRRLESRDLSLTTSMIPLGSCTMKLNAAAEMLPVTWPEFSRLHPFAPADQTQGYQVLTKQLEAWLAEITGLSAVSLQPNSGAAGEYAGLRVIRAYQEQMGQPHRKICLIPVSAHGTNPASAVMAGFQVVPVACDAQGNIEVADLKAKAVAHGQQLAAIMVTYPSTHGVFEEEIKAICRIVREQGGQVYMDGANLNAQVGLCRPGDIGADVCHLNLHKTFAIPHGGGGPGVGPIAVASHLAPFLPRHAVVDLGGQKHLGAVSSAPWGSAGILPISWMYIAMMGEPGLSQATSLAILNANYIARRIESYFPVYYKGKRGLVAHECILDLRACKQAGIEVEDVAKRLMDYGFHAPTISWPVHDTMMVEPTESESKAELDRFCEAMIAIHAEIKAVESGQADARDNLLKNAPHSAEAVVADQWTHPYSREQAAYPADWLREHKFWPPVGRIDNVYGDRNLVCTCAGMEAHGVPA